MKEKFLNLRILQEIDLELKTLREKLNRIPKRIEELNRYFEESKNSLESKRRALNEHRKQYKLAEVDLRAAEEKIATYSAQLYSVKTNEQYKAFLKEIETQKRLQAEIEDRLIALMEEAEELEKEIKSSEKSIGEIEKETKRKIELLNKEKEEINEAIVQREKRRTEVAERLPQELLLRYERIRKSKGGLAVTTTENERCNGCLSPIPPQRLLEIEREDKIYLCESCGRILLPVKENTTSARK
ncbi:MAG: C4-type zinc ribbon domain-containing protein [candidate division WOR-3 bacterium]